MLMTVFIGSSTEARGKAQAIQELLFEEAEQGTIRVIGWWHDDTFPVGEAFMEALESAVRNCNCAILLAAEEDNVTMRGEARFEARNNVILEYGMFAGAYGRTRTALAVIDNPRLPSDLNGISYLKLHTSPNNPFKELNRGRIRNWIRQVERIIREIPPPFETILPRLNKALMDLLKHQDHGKIDELAADLLEVIAGGMQSQYNYDTMSVQFLKQNLLQDCRSIFAVDVLGPRAWVTPSSYLYLAVQIRQYLRVNASEQGFDLKVDQTLNSAIDTALALARESGLTDSLTNFDDSLKWSQGEPKLQYARVLLWSKEDLLSPMAESVLAIHQAFHIPLFFKETAADKPIRKRDFILFEKHDGKVEGFVNMRENTYEYPDLSYIQGGKLPGGAVAIDFFRKLLSGGNLMFAVDQRKIWK